MAYFFPLSPPRLGLLGTPLRLDFEPPLPACFRLGTGRGLPARFILRSAIWLTSFRALGFGFGEPFSRVDGARYRQ